ncbi:MAG TPA: Gfo/Idh/MocA family oxidoreductase [Methylomirabilota bacterium]|nr:Gfo/Idh/MocA family oxidoreductase [Methylomirabilota bacterium]
MPKPAFSSGTARPLSRRQFVQYTGLATSAILGAPAILRGQNLNERIHVACIGVGGKGSSDTDSAFNLGGNIVALCDVDRNTLNAKHQALKDRAAKANRTYDAKLYQDFRKMFDELGKSIDAVTISTPDHVHGVAGITAMKMGKHVYCQKPLTQTVWEAREMRRLAKENKLATQMGNQGSGNDGLRRAVEVIQAGVIGAPRELHVWSNRPVWPQGHDRPPGEDKVPDHLDWDLWLGPAAHRPFKAGVYHSFAWRGWYDFGTGALGDMACHTVNMPFRALKLGYPSVVECELASRVPSETFPLTSRIRFEFPEREGLPPLKFWWYDGNPDPNAGHYKSTGFIKPLRPDAELTKEMLATRKSLPGSGCLIVGDKGKLFSPDDYGAQFFLLLEGDKEFKPGKDHEACKNIPQTIPRSPGHDKEWFDMMKGGPPAYSNFDIAAYLTEIILLGCVALRVGVGQRLDWDGPNMKARNTTAAERFVKRDYRKGWSV